MLPHEELAARLADSTPGGPRPLVTLSYAQSLDGSIAAARGSPLALSGDESLRFTHGLRACHDAILVGVGTVLADDPRLTARLVSGPQPRPLVLDTHLRTPPTARLLGHSRQPWLIAGPDPNVDLRLALAAAGARVIVGRLGQDGRLDLAETLGVLQTMGVGSIMVEGGARVITAFLAAGLVDWLAVTICPRIVGGLAGVESLPTPPHLTDVTWRQAGDDMLFWAKLEQTR